MKGPCIAISQEWFDRNPHMKDLFFEDIGAFLDALYDDPETLIAERIVLRSFQGWKLNIDENENGTYTINRA